MMPITRRIIMSSLNWEVISAPTLQPLQSEIQPKVSMEQEQEEMDKKKKRNKKERKESAKKKRKLRRTNSADDQGKEADEEKKKATGSTHHQQRQKVDPQKTQTTVAGAARDRVALAVESNSVLSSLLCRSAPLPQQPPQ